MSPLFKRLLAICSVLLIITAGSFFSLHAADDSFTNLNDAGGSSTALLAMIAQHTHNILIQVDKLPTYLNQLVTFTLNYLKADDSKSTSTMQGDFQALGHLIAQGLNQQTVLQGSLNKDLLGDSVIQNPTLLPDANDMLYSTLLGNPFLSPDPRQKANPSLPLDPAYNYIKNASGINLKHVMPTSAWQGSQDAQIRYKNYYAAVTAVESFNSYILSNVYAEAKDNAQFSQTQAKLILAASSADWFKEIASEELGKIFRKILMYESQLFIIATKLLTTQTQLLTAQVMSNTLLTAMNQTSEQFLLQKATGTPPTP